MTATANTTGARSKWPGHAAGDLVDMKCACGTKFKTKLRVKGQSLYACQRCVPCENKRRRESRWRKRDALGLPRILPRVKQSKWAGCKAGDVVDTTCVNEACGATFKSKVHIKGITPSVEPICGKCKYAKQQERENRNVVIVAKNPPAKVNAVPETLGLFGRPVKARELAKDNSYPDTSVPSGRRYLTDDCITVKLANVRRAFEAGIALIDEIDDDLARADAIRMKGSARETELENRLRVLEAAFKAAFAGREPTDSNGGGEG